jgi:prepilin-type N-terminal cleavage/methylation domain-containing protein
MNKHALQISRLRFAFTLVELLVVIAIIGVLAALLLPAVQSVRERARGVMCQNNLMQLINGVHQYEHRFGKYPTGTRQNEPGPILNAPQGLHHSWLTQILVFCDQPSIEKNLKADVSVYERANLPVRLVNLPLLKCTSETFRAGPYSNYAGCHHDTEAPINNDQVGLFVLNQAFTRDDITDGLGCTLFLGEKLNDAWDLGWVSGTRATLRNAGTPVNAIRAVQARQAAKGSFSAPPSTNWESLPAEYDPFPLAEFVPLPAPEATPAPPPAPSPPPEAAPVDADANAPLPPPVPPVDAALSPDLAPVVSTVPRPPKYPPPSSNQTVGGFASMHPTLAHFAFGDGSIRRLYQEIDPLVYQQLANRRDGKLPPDLTRY